MTRIEMPPDSGDGVDGERRAPGGGARYEITMTVLLAEVLLAEVESARRMNRRGYHHSTGGSTAHFPETLLRRLAIRSTEWPVACSGTSSHEPSQQPWKDSDAPSLEVAGARARRGRRARGRRLVLLPEVGPRTARRDRGDPGRHRGHGRGAGRVLRCRRDVDREAGRLADLRGLPRDGEAVREHLRDRGHRPHRRRRRYVDHRRHHR